MARVENFVWCAHDCGSGQIHESGPEQPIVVCRKCKRRTCSLCEVAWHENLTCAEYEQQKDDPDFRGHVELENEKWSEAKKATAAQEKADRAMARREREREAERARQEKTKAKAKEKAKAEKAAEERRRNAARKKADEAKTRALLKTTTKPCQGCGWAIEKNAGW
ncbi:hypothetical protein IL306_003549 [Fusarium sp. DS 682]|nr:hypothetical protein IL306_003549 [Fusarium sp. DS 682]